MNTTNEEARQFLTLDEVADRLAVNRRTIEREIQRGRFPKPLQVGRALRVSVADFLRYVNGAGPKVATP